MKKLHGGAFLLVAVFAAGILALFSGKAKSPSQSTRFAGSTSCRECHEKFYQLWSTSFHGLAMQPYTAEFARAKLTRHVKEIPSVARP